MALGGSYRLLCRQSKLLKNPLYLLYFSGFLDLFGVSMIMPLILPYARGLGASPTIAGILGSVYGGLQLLSSPVMGQWSDSLGRHCALCVCLAASGIGYIFMGFAASVILLLLSRIPLGIFKHSQNFSKIYLADIIPGRQRSEVLGNFNAASSIGFIMGPMIGGHVAELPGGFRYVAFLAGAVFLLNAAMVWLALPSAKPAHRADKRVEERNFTHSDSTISLKKLASEELSFNPKFMIQSFKTIDWHDLWDLFFIKFLAGFSVIIFRNNFNIVLKQKFSASPKMLGYMMSYSGTVAALCGFCVGHFTKMYSSIATVFFHMLLLQCASLVAVTLASSMMMVMVALTPLSFVTTTLRVVATDLTIKRGGKQSRGALMGLSQSVMSLARMLSPFLAGVAQEVHIDGPSVIAIVTTIIAAVIMYLRPQDPEKRKQKME